MKTNLTTKEQLEKRNSCFNYYKTSKLTFLQTIMLFFKASYDKEFENSFIFLLNHCLQDKQCLYKVTFTNNNKLMIDNKLENLTFLSFKELINNYFMLNNDYLKRNINYNAKCFIQVDKQMDNTYYNVYLLSKKSIKEFQTLVNYTNFKYKFNFNTKERKLVFKLKNNYLKGFKYSYNHFYFLDLLQDIETTKEQLQDIETNLKLLDIDYNNIKQDMNNFKELKQVIETLNQDLIKLSVKYSKLLDEKQTLENKLLNLENKKDNLIYSSNENETTLNDYKLENSYL